MMLLIISFHCCVITAYNCVIVSRSRINKLYYSVIYIIFMDFKLKLLKCLNKQLNADVVLEVPPNPSFGDFALPCFKLKKSPADIQNSLKSLPKFIQRIEIKGAYLNFFVDNSIFYKEVIGTILKEKEKYGCSNIGKGKTIVIDMSSPNIAKPFGIGHLRSTIIGNSISLTASKLDFKVIKLNYLGDWGTPFGKIIAAFKDFGSEKELLKDPIKHLYGLYVKASSIDKYEELGRQWFNKLESSDKEAISLWSKFRDLSIKEFNKIYSMLGVKFDVISGESKYSDKMGKVIKDLESKGLLVESDGAKIINLEEYNLGVMLIQKSDGSTLYATRDITGAIDRIKTYKATNLFYEVGSEQTLHFKQLFKVLELMGYSWAKDCVHINHGLYLDADGKKFATRKGKTVFMIDIINEAITLAKETIKSKNPNLKNKNKIANIVGVGAIIFGDLKNNRVRDITFDIERFLDFEGDTGPYLQYTHARAASILRKCEQPKVFIGLEISSQEAALIKRLADYPGVLISANKELGPHILANYCLELAHSFNEFYHACPVLTAEGKEKDKRIAIVKASKIVLSDAMKMLGIKVPDEM